jgi:hypothetical protein
MGIKTRIAYCLLFVGLAITVVGGPSGLRAEEQQPQRDLYIKSANPDGTVNCAKWCGITEPCC